jgi:glycerol-3-phosphate acyltransferase PlsX
VTKKKEIKKPDNKKIRIALDVMGGDYAPQEIIKGGLLASQDSELEVLLVGPEKTVKEGLERCGYTGSGVSIINASEVIGMGEAPVLAIKTKKDSSIVVGIDLLKRGEASAFVSAGNTGAIVTAATLTLGKKKGVSRPALGAIFGFPTGPILCLDIGANAECKPEMLVQFAHMGSIYMEKVFGIPQPRIGLLSNGEEETKGCKTVQKAHKMLKKAKVNFIGNVEGRDLPRGVADVLVTDGFTGNILLKTGEGIGEMLVHALRDTMKGNPRLNEAVDILTPVVASVIGMLDYTEYGGALLLGVEGNVIVGHGRSNALAIKNAITTAKREVVQGVAEAMKG